MKLRLQMLEERLKEISAQIIEAHKESDPEVAYLYAQQAKLPQGTLALPANRLFVKVIQLYHPDKAQQIWAELEGMGLDKPATQKLFQTTYAVLPARRRQIPGDYDVAPEYAEQYMYDDDLGFGVEDVESDHDADPGDDIWDDDWDEAWVDDQDDDFEVVDSPEVTFTQALKRELFGNLEIYPSARDAEKLDGELDLSDYDINDLAGAEHCIHVASLNLAHNQIQQVGALGDLGYLEFLDLSHNLIDSADELVGLSSLRELDLSYNDIEDAAFLLRLPSLRFVNLLGNPVGDRVVVDRLKSRGVFVLV